MTAITVALAVYGLLATLSAIRSNYYARKATQMAIQSSLLAARIYLLDTQPNGRQRQAMQETVEELEDVAEMAGFTIPPKETP